MQTIEFKDETLLVHKTKYGNGRIAIRLLDEEGFPYMMATVNIPEHSILKNYTFIKNYSENSGILEALTNQGIVRPTGKAVKIGFALVDEVEVL